MSVCLSQQAGAVLGSAFHCVPSTEHTAGHVGDFHLCVCVSVYVFIYVSVSLKVCHLI